MSWEHVVWAAFVFSTFAFAGAELCSWIGSKRTRPLRRGRLAVLLLPAVATLVVLLLSWTAARHARNLGLAIADRDVEKSERYFAERVTLGVKEYARGPELVARFAGKGSMTRNEVDGLKFLPSFDPCDPLHIYLEPVVEHSMPGLTLLRLRLTPAGWKLDGVLAWGCMMGEGDAAFLARLWTMPGFSGR